MNEKWAVVTRQRDAEQGRYHWVRDAGGSIVVFASQWQAMKWIRRFTAHDEEENEVLYLKIEAQAS